MEEIYTVNPYSENLYDLRGYYEDLSSEYSHVVEEYNLLLSNYSELEDSYEELKEEYNYLEETNYSMDSDLKCSTSILVFITIILFFAWLYEKGK